MFQAKTENELVGLFLLARYAQADFKVAGIPQDIGDSGNTMSFAPQAMRGLFDIGYRGGEDGTAWQALPPGFGPERFTIARSGTRFATTGKTTSPEPWRPEELRITLGTE